ncbi:hypothetical protein [Streptomyces phaeofaciens]|uniref:hypothetical protein n=1 Tax=Streptomyces phaeofaciens TaxID=68254 RepID=UPI00368864CA
MVDGGGGAMMVTRFKGALLIVASVLAALACWSAFSAWLPSGLGRHREYGEAAPCPGRAPVQRYEDCLRTVTFTVEGTDIPRAKKKGYRATLSGTPFWDGAVAFGDRDPLLTELRPGDRVTGTVWRGQVMTIAGGGARQSTTDEPRDEPQMPVALGTGAGLLAVLGLVFGSALMLRPGRRERFVWQPYGRRLLITTVSASFLAGLLGVGTGLPWWLVPAVAVLVVWAGAVLIYGWDRPEGDMPRTGIF